jgi:hypothetical protein
MFPNVKKMYKSVWKSMIKPQKIDYTEMSLGHQYIQVGEKWAKREDYEINNVRGQTIKVTVYYPLDGAPVIKFTFLEVFKLKYCTIN